MRMNPPQRHQIMLIYVIEQCALIYCIASIRCSFLFRDDEFGDEEGVGDEGSAEDSTGFEVLLGVWRGDAEEVVSEVGVYEDGAEGGAGFGVGGGHKGVVLGVRVGGL